MKSLSLWQPWASLIAAGVKPLKIPAPFQGRQGLFDVPNALVES